MDFDGYDPGDIEETSCPLCQSAEGRVAYRFPPFAVTLCRTCGLHYLSPRLREEAMLRIYRRGDYFSGADQGYADYEGQAQALRLTFRRFLERMHRENLTGGSLLEIGCGYGYFLDEARNFFRYRCGTEFSLKAVREATPRADVIYRGSIDALPAEERFDCVVGIQMVEHVHRPVAFLQKAVQALRPDGLLVLVTPSMGSFWRTLCGRRWPSFKIPEHVVYFRERTLSLLMEKSGLSGVGALPYPHAFPLALVFQKLGIRLPPALRDRPIWIPRTSIAMHGRRRSEG